MRRKNIWIKILALTNFISLMFLTVIALHYKVPQKVLNKIGVIKYEPVSAYSYIRYRQKAVHSLVNVENGFETVMLGILLRNG